MPISIFLGDAMGFLGERGGQVVVEKGLKLNLVHLTAVPPWTTTMKETLAEIEKFKKMIQEQPSLMLIKNQKELSDAIAEKKIGVVLGMQNTPIDIFNDSGAILMLRKAGISIISPCYNKQNDFGSGWLNADIGLTGKGKILLKECAENRVIVDLSHSGHRMARDIIEYVISYGTRIKLIASHGGCYSQYHHFRNLPDDVLKNVAALGGIVGISTLTFSNDECDNSVFPFNVHLSRAISLCGEDSVCVGSDDLYITRDVEESRKQFEVMSKKLDPLGTQGARYPENPIEVSGPDMLEKLFEFCNRDPFQTKVLVKVFGQNLLNFFKRALPAE